MTTLLLQFGNWLLLAGVVLFADGGVQRHARRVGRRAGPPTMEFGRSALNKTRRWALVATIAFMLTGALAFYFDQQPPHDRRRQYRHADSRPGGCSQQDAADRYSDACGSYADAPRPTVLPSPTLSLVPPPTLAPATATPSPNVPAILQTPVPGAVPVAPNAKLTFTTLASVADNKGNPVDPGLAFPGGTRRVRLYFRAANVNNGATWSVLCYKGDQLVDSCG